MSKQHINLENTTPHVSLPYLNNTAKDEYTDSSEYIRKLIPDIPMPTST